MKKLSKDNKTLHYKVINKNIKHSYIRPKNGYILISKSNKMALDFILEKVYSDFDYYYERVIEKEEDSLSLWGKIYQLRLISSPFFNYEIKDEEIIVQTNKNDYHLIKEKILTNELIKHLNNNKKDISKKLKKEKYYEVPLKFKLLKSKYGSYNNNKKNEYIVLNVFLATLEKEFSLYVLYHEYAHQKVKNHQKEFYNKLDSLFPQHRMYQKRLKDIRLII